MEILLSPKAGFCFGVRRAVEMAERTIAKASGPVATLGSLIHNPVVVENLAQRGVRAVGSPAEAGSGTLIIRSHGAPPSAIAEARRLGLTVVDATCPFVRKAQQLAKGLAASGRQLVVIGDPGHPEIKGVVAAAGQALVVADADELDPGRLGPRVGLICQTTLAPEPLARVAALIAPSCQELIVYNTICTATFERQQAAIALAKTVQAMVVVGGKESANTTHLAEVCRQYTPTYQVERAQELRPSWFAACGRIGITAGASTPGEQIDHVFARLQKLAQEGKS